MKYVIVRCEDAAAGNDQTASLLDSAKTAYLQELAQAGAAGRLSQGADHTPLDRFQLHRLLFGLDAQDPAAAAGQCYAASGNLQLAPEETAWCCEFVAQRDGVLIDPSAGRITTKESRILIQTLDDRLGSETRRWEVGSGAHHVLVTSEPAFKAERFPPLKGPDLLVNQVWERHLPKGEAGETLRTVIEPASTLLDSHPVNRVRIDLGENPANMVWLWGPADAGPQQAFKERTGLSGVVCSNSFLLRGFARSLSLDWAEGPASFEEGALQRLMETLRRALDRHDFAYVHVSIDSPDPVQRLCAMERLDRIVFKSLTELLSSLGPWRLSAVVDDRASAHVPFIAIGTGIPQQPIARLDANRFAESPLAFDSGAGWFSWFINTAVGVMRDAPAHLGEPPG